MPSRPPQSYGSFCPVAQASEVVAQRWVPLVVREIMVGYHRFNEIRRALPLISPSVLAQRLKLLEENGIITRQTDAGGVSYHLTPAGEELAPIIQSLGHWAHKWISRDYRSDQLDPAVMMWALRRHIRAAAFPSGRSVLHFILEGEPSRRRYWWVVVDRDAEPDVDICQSDPGHRVTLTITTTVRAMADVLAPNTELAESLKRGLITVRGDAELAKRFDTLFALESEWGVRPAD
jgi:DNA-binding HxlR family transcriptional regulator